MLLTDQATNSKLSLRNKLLICEKEDLHLIKVNKTVCKRIAYYRQKCNLTQEELATSVGINLKHLINIEAELRIPRIEELAQLAAGLGISIDELFNGK